MLIVFAAALYMGWLPANSSQANLAAEKPVVPVMKSPPVALAGGRGAELEPNARAHFQRMVERRQQND